MSMITPELWLDLERAHLQRLDRQFEHHAAPPRGRSPAAGVRARLAAAIRVLLAQSETVAEIHHLVLSGGRAEAERRRDCA